MQAWCRLICLILCLSMTAGAARALPNPSLTVETPVYDKWALIVGISKFKDSSINLKYSAKDARDFYNFLIREGNFAPDHVKMLINEEASRENILSALGDKWLPRVANPNDLVVIYISSHGSPSGMDVGGVNYIVAYDTNKESLFSTGIPMQDLVRIIKGRVHSDRIVLILDACHSGAANPDGKAVFHQGNVNVDDIVAGTGQLVISSSQPDQVSWESKGEPNGVFTKFLIEGLKHNGTKTTLGEAYGFMKDKVQEEVLSERGVLQTPVLKSKWEGKELALLAPPARPRPGLKEQPASAAEPATVRSPAATVPATVPAKPQPAEESQATLWDTYMDTARRQLLDKHFLEARRMLNEAQKEVENATPGDPRRTSTLMELAEVCYLEGKFNEAEPMYWRVVSDLESTGGADKPQAGTALARLAGIQVARGQYADSEKLAARALSIQEKTRQDDPAAAARTLAIMAAAALGRNDSKEAEALSRRALAGLEASPDANEQELVKLLCCLNKALIAQEKFADAEPTAQKAVTLADKSFTANASETAECLEIYAQVLAKLDRTAESKRCDIRAKSIRRKLSKESTYR